jgi:phosphoadenosine phosphosulfate reductase
MVKKRLASGEVCKKCLEVESFLEARGLMSHIDVIVWADERDPGSAGWELAKLHGVALAPFFVVEEEGRTTALTSAVQVARLLSSGGGDGSAGPPSEEPLEVVRWALSRWGRDCAIAFSGAEDVVLIDLAHRTGHPFSAFVLDTGRLHPETLAFVDTVRQRYGLDLEVFFPDYRAVERLVRAKGTMSFLTDGHGECCGIRKVAPLARALEGRRAWMTGLRPDQSPATRHALPIVEEDARHLGPSGPLVKVNPLARWGAAEVWAWIREHEVPFNPLHLQGYRSIGCAPCTRPVHPGQHEREGRWWWEEATRRECGLHFK